MKRNCILAILMAILQICSAAVVKQTLDITWRETSPDGFKRKVIVMNGNSPGPTIKCVLGDELQITVLNNINMPVSVHWHGIVQINSNNMDGVPGVTQRAIAPKSSFLYKFKPTAPGTFWYHSHFHTEYMDGLRGALIVIDPKAPVYKRDSVVMLADWYEKESESILKNVVLAPGGSSEEPLPTGGLVNGIGQRLGSACSLGCPTTCAKTATYNCPQCKTGEKAKRCLFKQVQAQPGGSCAKPATKLRFIAGAGYVGFSITIDDHLMQIVSADLMPVKPVTVGTLYINVGQRYDVLVCRKNNPTAVTPVWMRIRMEALNPLSKILNKDFLAVLTYQKPEPNVTVIPTSKPDKVLFATNVNKVYPQQSIKIDPLVAKRFDLDPKGLELVNPKPVPKATRAQPINWVLGFTPDMKTKVMRAVVNGVSFNADLNGPALISLIKPGQPFKTKVPGLYLDWIKKGEVVDFYVQNADYRVHPIHMHGYDVWIMAQGKTLELPNIKNFKDIKLSAKPLMRDTVTVMPQSYAVLRIDARNVGVWLMHCHVEWHIAAGMVNAYQVY